MKGQFSLKQKNLAKEMLKHNYSINSYDAKNVLELKKGKTIIKFLTPLNFKG